MYKAIDKWLPGYVRHVLRAGGRGRARRATQHLILCFADHFEPLGRGASAEEARSCVHAWAERYPRLFAAFRDADGKPPRHTFFYPAEEYDPVCVEGLGSLVAGGWGEVEIHLHHRNDTPEGLRAKLVQFRDCLREKHGLLGSGPDGQPRYGFVHGNWALCNSRPDGDWCGVNEELGILSQTGCYADFTFPSAPSPTQSRMVNAIYYARDVPGRSRGHDRGEPVRARREEQRAMIQEQRAGASADGETRGANGDALMLIQGPLALNWSRRKWGLLPRLENGEITAVNPPDPGRIRLWVRQHIHVQGKQDWTFVKVHSHGAVGVNMATVLGEPMQRAHAFLQECFNDGTRWRLHYTSSREMYNIIRAAESGAGSDPGECRDFEIAPPPRRKREP